MSPCTSFHTSAPPASPYPIALCSWPQVPSMPEAPPALTSLARPSGYHRFLHRAWALCRELPSALRHLGVVGAPQGTPGHWGSEPRPRGMPGNRGDSVPPGMPGERGAEVGHARIQRGYAAWGDACWDTGGWGVIAPVLDSPLHCPMQSLPVHGAAQSTRVHMCAWRAQHSHPQQREHRESKSPTWPRARTGETPHRRPLPPETLPSTRP